MRFEELDDLGKNGSVGGFGSGWQGPRKATIEESLVLTASTLVRRKSLVPGAHTFGSWGWTHEGEDEPHATIGYQADLTDPKAAWLRLHYRWRGEPVDYRVRLVTTKPTYGGLRWWFICPLVRRDGGPSRRIAKLYLPPGSRYFGSREGHGLTYTSCRESGKFRGLFRHLAAEMGVDDAIIRTALNRGLLP
jgi:hypothetical protein